MSVPRPRPIPPRAALAALALLVAVLVAPLPVAAGTATGASPDAERAAEALAARLIDDARAGVGLAALLPDATVTAVARARADDMCARRYFAHTAPDGTTAFDLLDRSRIAWASASEAIGWNDVPDAAESARRVVGDWLASGEHAEILLAADRDVVGLASALDAATGRRTWVLVTIARPVPAPPGLDLHLVRVGRRDATGARLATLRWTTRAAAGAPLAPVTGVTVQVRPSGGRWSTVVQGRAAATVRIRVRAAGAFEVRIRARGPAGVVGPWTALRVSG